MGFKLTVREDAPIYPPESGTIRKEMADLKSRCEELEKELAELKKPKSEGDWYWVGSMKARVTELEKRLQDSEAGAARMRALFVDIRDFADAIGVEFCLASRHEDGAVNAVTDIFRKHAISSQRIDDVLHVQNAGREFLAKHERALEALRIYGNVSEHGRFCEVLYPATDMLCSCGLADADKLRREVLGE